MSTYVALGSSYAAGPGIAPVVNAGALRSGRNYAHQIAGRLSLQLTDVTCSGATTANILRTPQRTFTGSMRPQIEAVTSVTRLVTITAGGNDVAYIGALTKGSNASALAQRLSALPEQLTGRLRGSAGYRTRPGQFDAVTASLTEIVRQVRTRAPEARVMLVDYLTVLGPDARTGTRLPLAAAQISQVRETAAALAGAFARAAALCGADLVKASGASAGHGLGSAEPWVTGFQFGNPFRGGPVPYHPNLAGMTAVAGLVAEQLRQAGWQA
jgi:lysophospholipase L1-like esterase